MNSPASQTEVGYLPESWEANRPDRGAVLGTVQEMDEDRIVPHRPSTRRPE